MGCPAFWLTWKLGEVEVYDIEVEGLHNFFVRGPGSDAPGVLVHNSTVPRWKPKGMLGGDRTGLKDHAARHSDLSPAAYLARGQRNVTHGKRLKGGGLYPNVSYYVRRVGDDAYSVTMVDKADDILSIDTWQRGGTRMTRSAVEAGLSLSGVTPLWGFWDSL